MAASALDMSLDDVIKTKGKGQASGNRNGRGRATKGVVADKTKQAKKAAPRAAEKATEAPARKVLGKFAKGMAASALSPAAKAAAAAAKATASTTTPAAPVRRGGGAPAAARRTGNSAGQRRQSNAASAALAAPVSGKGTEAKLSMTLDDICKSEVKGKRGAAGTKKAAVAGKGVTGAIAKRGAMRLGRALKLRSDGKQTQAGAKGLAKSPKGKAKAKAKAGTKTAKGKGKGKLAELWEWESWAPSARAGRNAAQSYDSGKGKGAKGGKAGKGKGWSEWAAWDDSWRKGASKGASKGDWGAAMKRKIADEWDAPPAAKRGRGAHDIKGSYGFDDPRETAADRWGKGAGSRPPVWVRQDADDERPVRGRQAASGRMADRDRAWSTSGISRAAAPTNREVRGSGTARAPPARARPETRGASGAGCRIKVMGIPRNLDQRDIEEAFEDVGEVRSCRLVGRDAYITFAKAQDAKKAMNTFDRGELNGQTIYVTAE